MPIELQASHQAQLTTGTVPNMAANAADIANRGGSDETPDVIRTAAYEDPALTPKFRDSGIPVAGTTYLLGASKLNGDPAARAWLRVGARLLLRQRPRSAADTGELPRPVEVQAPDGRLLGRLPPGDAQAVEELLDAGVSATARVVAMVPAFRRERVQLTIEIRRTASDPTL
jgi:hypothetical protein